jgi:hypothetical protein
VPPSTCGSNDSYLLLGGNSNSVGKYCADGGGQMSVGSYEGDQRYEYKASDWKNITKEDVTAGGIQGTKQTATAYNQGELLGALPDGTLQVKYIFYTNGRTYIAIYSKFDSYPDVLSDFNLMVTKTLKFTQ